MKKSKKFSLFIFFVIAHFVATLAIAVRIIDCDANSGCLKEFDHVWQELVAFPLLSIFELAGSLGGNAGHGYHFSGSLLFIIMPINSLLAIAIYLILLRWLMRSVSKK